MPDGGIKLDVASETGATGIVSGGGGGDGDGGSESRGDLWLDMNLCLFRGRVSSNAVLHSIRNSKFSFSNIISHSCRYYK
jgi:hypothetical protein